MNIKNPGLVMNTPGLIITLRSDCLSNIDQIQLCLLEVNLGSKDGISSLEIQ